MPMKHLGIADRGTCTTAWPHSAKADRLPAPEWVNPCEAIQERKNRHTQPDVADMDMGQVLPAFGAAGLALVGSQPQLGTYHPCTPGKLARASDKGHLFGYVWPMNSSANSI